MKYQYNIVGRDAEGKRHVVIGIVTCPFASTFDAAMREAAERFHNSGPCPWQIEKLQIELEKDKS